MILHSAKLIITMSCKCKCSGNWNSWISNMKKKLIKHGEKPIDFSAWRDFFNLTFIFEKTCINKKLMVKIVG